MRNRIDIRYRRERSRRLSVAAGALGRGAPARQALLATALLTALALALAAPAGAASGVTTANSVAWAVSQVNASTTSQVWQGVPEMTVNVTLKKTADLIIDYCSEAITDPGEIQLVRVAVGAGSFASPDGAGGGGVIYAYDNSSYLNDVQCMTWVYQGLAPGTHPVSVEWRSWNGARVYTAWRSMKVLFDSNAKP